MADKEYRHAVKFEADVNKFAENFGIDVSQALRNLALSIFRSLVQETPIKTGRARGSWNIDIDKIDLNKLPEREPGPFAWQAIMNNKALVFNQKDLNLDENSSLTIYITNNLSYINKLNNSHSKQQPIAGYVQRIFERWAAYINSSVSNVGK